MSCAKIEPVTRIRNHALPLVFQVAIYQNSSLEKLLKSEKEDTVYRIQAVDKIRSPQQNNLFHGPILDAMVNWQGDTDRDYWKAVLKHKFLRMQNDEGVLITRGTSELTVQEFNLFINKCATWIIDNGGGQYLPPDIMPM
jgi:hypothetical protein